MFSTKGSFGHIVNAVAIVDAAFADAISETRTVSNATLADATLVFWIAARAAIYRSLRALRPQNRKKVWKGVFSGSGEKSQKNARKSLKMPKKYPKQSENRYF